MAASSEVPNFADPLTLALFDRTPQQRQDFCRHMLAIINNQESGGKARVIQTSIEMYHGFLADVESAVSQRAEDLHTVDLVGRQLPPLCDGDEAYRAVALEEITAEIAQLHEALPLPMIERLRAPV